MGVIYITKSAGKFLGTKTLRLPRKRKKQLKKNFGDKWSSHVKVKFK